MVGGRNANGETAGGCRATTALLPVPEIGTEEGKEVGPAWSGRCVS